MKKLISNLWLVAAVMMLSVPALAATETGAPSFDILDADQDGYISGEEAAPVESISKNFEKLDANKDGKLDKTEFAAVKTVKEQG